MATRLEASGIGRHQAAATLEAIANSIEKFAVTPQRLRAILDESQQALYERIREENDQRFDAVDKRFGDVITTIHDLRQQQRSDSVKVFNLMLGIALGMAGVTGGLIFNLLFP